jgi:LPXTG-motif cell wall-anchored protein
LSIPRKLFWCFVLGLSFFPRFAAADVHSKKFIAPEPTNIPGLTLPPGSYSIAAVFRTSDRYVVLVEGSRIRGRYHFLAIANPEIPKPATPGLVLWNNPAGGKQFLREWYFAGAPSVLEFVYPKAEAVAIAKSNQATVPAIDPASEGRPVTIQGLSKSDLELVNLWLLIPTKVGSDDSTGGIQAKRYTNVASAERKPVISRLPQTGSNLPLIALLGGCFLTAAMAIRVFRPAYARRSLTRQRRQYTHDQNNANRA